jgi:hypothetical protein
VPLISVPIKLPCTVLPEPFPSPIPEPVFPEIKLRASGVVPPIVQFDGVPQKPKMIPPFPPDPFGNAATPAGPVPMKFPSITLPSVQTSMPSCTNLLMTNPRTMQFGALMMSPLKLVAGTPGPLSWILKTVLRPMVGGLVFALDPDCV